MSKREMRKELVELNFTEKVKVLEKLRDRSESLAASGLRPKSPPQSMLSRSSIEAYIGIGLAIVLALVALTWWMKILLLLFLAYGIADISFRSPWTARFRWPVRCVVCVVGLLLLGATSWESVYGQFKLGRAPTFSAGQREERVTQGSDRTEAPQQVAKMTRAVRPSKKRTGRVTGTPPVPRSDAKSQPAPEQSCPNGICIGGDNNGSAVVNNYGTPASPPLEMKWAARDVVPSTKSDFPYEKEVTITVNTPLTPAAVAVVCDEDIGSISHNLKNGEVSFNVHEIIDADRRKGFIYFEGNGVTPRNPLLIHLWSSRPLSITAVGRAVLPGLND
jgi:hypothetical protein